MARFPTNASDIKDFSNPWCVRLFKGRAHTANARARRFNIPGRITFDELVSVYERGGWKCVACGSDNDLHTDHIVPMSVGGTNAPDNLQVLCEQCNCSKRNKTN